MRLFATLPEPLAQFVLQDCNRLHMSAQEYVRHLVRERMSASPIATPVAIVQPGATPATSLPSPVVSAGFNRQAAIQRYLDAGETQETAELYTGYDEDHIDEDYINDDDADAK